MSSTQIVFASGERSSTSTSATFTNTGEETGGDFIIDTTVVGTFTTLIVEGQDSLSGKWYEIGRTDSWNQAITRVLKIHPYITPVATTPDHTLTAVSATLPTTWRVVVGFSSPVATTFSVGANLYSGVGTGLSNLT